MTYAKTVVAVMAYLLVMNAGDVVGQESRSSTIFAPVFAADFEDVLIETPSNIPLIDEKKTKSAEQSLLNLAMALKAESRIPSNMSQRQKAIGVSYANKKAKCCTTCCTDCQSCCWQPSENAKAHCQLMAKLLAAALQDREQSQDAQRKVIEGALMMIAETSEAKAQARIALMEANYQKQLTELHNQIKRSATPTNSFSQIREWLGPIYTNQNRNFHQMKTIAANSANLSRTVGLLQKKIDAKLEPNLPKQIQNRLYGMSSATELTNNDPVPSNRLQPQIDRRVPNVSQRIDTSEQANRLRHEIQALQVRLQELQQKDVRPANHLEPVYSPDRPLKPLYQR